MSSGNPTPPTPTKTPVKPAPVNNTKQMFNQEDYPTPVGVKFARKQRDYQLFPEEYFTSTDCQIYMNDVYIEDMTGLTFALFEKTEGIFGYASNTWDYFARGQRIVQGQFRIAFREAGYLWTLMDHFGQKGGQTKTHLAWLMNDAQRNIYNGYNGAPERTFGQVLETIEDVFYRNHADQNAKLPDTTGKKKETIYFKWDVKDTHMKLGESDKTARHSNVEERYGTKGAVTQLQTWLKRNKYDIKPVTLNWKQRYSGDTWYKEYGNDKLIWNGSASDKNAQPRFAPVIDQGLFSNKFIDEAMNAAAAAGIKVTRPAKTDGDWYVIMRYAPRSAYGVTKHAPIIRRSEAHSWYERELQEAIDRYPGELDNFWMGSPDGKTLRYDGRYGSGPAEAIQILMRIAGYNDGSNGYWVSSTTKKYLEMGLSINGQYDFPTKMAVYLFQANMAKKGKLKSSQVTGAVDYDTMRLMTEEREVEYTIEGASLYKPEELYESRMAMYEREVWGRAFVEDAEAVRKTESFFYRGRLDESKKDGTLYTDVLHQKGVDIYINYGPLSQYVRSKLFEISHDVSFNTTVKALRNVQIYDVQQVLDPNSGQCIEEVYSFYAKDLD